MGTARSIPPHNSAFSFDDTMRLSHQIIVIGILILLFTGCGKWPPVVNNAGDIKKLSIDEKSLRARGLSDHDLYALERFKNLTILDFDGGWAVKEVKITDNGLSILSKLNLPIVETLALGHNNNITDIGLKHLVNMKSVKWLSLMICPNITDKGLNNLISMSTLEALDLRGCAAITDSGLEYLSQMKNIKQVLLGGCEKITSEAVIKLQVQLPNAKIEKDEKEWSYHKNG